MDPVAPNRALRVLSRALPWLIGAFYVMACADEHSLVASLPGLALGVTIGVALRYRYERPEAATAVVLAASLAAHVLAPEIVIPLGGLVAVYALARARPPRVSLVGLAGLQALVAVNLATALLEDTLFTFAVSVAAWALGEAARSRNAAIEEATRRAVTDEQARIARELHDVVAHSVSVIVVQAAAAGDVFDARPDQAKASLAAIESAGREALAELRRLLSAVRTDPQEEPPHAPQPGLDGVDRLVEPFRAAGLTVVVTREGEPRPLPPGVDVSAYRIVQEALTNTLRHARATTAEVTVRLATEAVEVEVVDDGRGHGGHGRTSPPGFGLIGMRERAAALGGTCEAGPTAHGGFRVLARLPLEPAEAP